MPTSHTDRIVDDNRSRATTRLEKDLADQLAIALEHDDHLVSLCSTQPSQWLELDVFVRTANRLAVQHKALDIKFFQLDNSTSGTEICHIAVLKFPLVTRVRS